MDKKKFLAISLTVIIAFSLCCTVVSAASYTVGDHEYYDLPVNHIDDYPQTPDGYMAFLYDTCYVVSNNWGEFKGYNEAWENWNDVCTYFFGDDTPIQHNVPDPRSVLSDYYFHGGSAEGHSQNVWSDGHGGYFYVDIYPNPQGADYNDCTVYYVSSSGRVDDVGHWGWYGCDSYSFNVDSYDGSRVYYTVTGTNKYGDHFNDSWRYDCPYGVTMSQDDVPMSVGGLCHGLKGHIYRDPNGNLHFISDDDDGGDYPFNPDGTVHFPDGDFYFDPDPKTLKDDDKDVIDNNTDLWTLLTFQILKNVGNDNNSSSGCHCPDYTTYLLQINSRLNNIENKETSMINLLKKIEKNTRGNDDNVFDNTVMDLVLPEDEDVQIEFLSDAIMRKVNFGQYFTQLSNLLYIAMGNDFVNTTDFDKYFDLQKYIGSDDKIKMTTRDAKALYGDDLAEANIDVCDSDYLSATAMSRGVVSEQYKSSVSSQLVVIPAIWVTIGDEQYNMFDWITPEIYDYIRPLKNLISLILQICWTFWVIKWLPNIIHNVGSVADYKE